MRNNGNPRYIRRNDERGWVVRDCHVMHLVWEQHKKHGIVLFCTVNSKIKSKFTLLVNNLAMHEPQLSAAIT